MGGTGRQDDVLWRHDYGMNNGGRCRYVLVTASSTGRRPEHQGGDNDPDYAARDLRSLGSVHPLASRESSGCERTQFRTRLPESLAAVHADLPNLSTSLAFHSQRSPALVGHGRCAITDLAESIVDIEPQEPELAHDAPEEDS